MNAAVGVSGQLTQAYPQLSSGPPSRCALKQLIGALAQVRPARLASLWATALSSVRAAADAAFHATDSAAAMVIIKESFALAAAALACPLYDTQPILVRSPALCTLWCAAHPGAQAALTGPTLASSLRRDRVQCCSVLAHRHLSI